MTSPLAVVPRAQPRSSNVRLLHPALPRADSLAALRRQNAELREEVVQLRAAVELYRAVAERLRRQ